MNDDFRPASPAPTARPPPRGKTIRSAPRRSSSSATRSSSCARRNDRKHQDFERTLAKMRDELKGSFDSFAAATQRAYQDLRKETVGEKKFSMDLLMLLLEISQDLEHIMEHKPQPDDAEAVKGWMEARRGARRARSRR